MNFADMMSLSFVNEYGFLIEESERREEKRHEIFDNSQLPTSNFQGTPNLQLPTPPPI